MLSGGGEGKRLLGPFRPEAARSSAAEVWRGSMCVCVDVYMCVHAYVHGWAGMCVCTGMCVYGWAWVYTCARVGVHVYVGGLCECA